MATSTPTPPEWRSLAVPEATQLERDRVALRLVLDELQADPTNPHIRRNAADLMKRIGSVGPAPAFPPEGPGTVAMSADLDQPKAIRASWQSAPLVDEKGGSRWESAPIVEDKPSVGGAAFREDVQRRAEASPWSQTTAATSGTLRGIASLLGIPIDTAANLVDLMKAGAGAAYGGIAGRAPPTALDPMSRAGIPGSSEWIARMIESVPRGFNQQGVPIGQASLSNPSPEDPASRMLFTGGKIVGGSMLPGQAPRQMIAGAAIPAVGGAIGGELGGPVGEVAGAMGPTMTAAGGAALKQRFADPARAQRNIAAFDQAGAPGITAGQATESSFFRGIENLIAKMPGGQGIMRRFAERQQAGIGARASTGVSAEDAGMAIERGIRGEGGYLQRSRQQWQQLDNQLAAEIPPTTRMVPAQTLATLERFTTPSFGAEASTGGLINQEMARLRQNLITDLQNNQGGMPFHGVRELRTRIGDALEDSMVRGVPQGELSQVYRAMSRDLERAAGEAGAGAAFSRQNAFYRDRMHRIEQVLERVVGKQSEPEAIFERLMPKSPDQITRVRETFASLAPAEREVVSAAIINRLGRAKPGVQTTPEGDMFSTETFLTNWTRIGNEAKRHILTDPDMRSDMEAVASAAANIRAGSNVMKNPAGTAGALTGYGIFGLVMSGVLTGSGNALKLAGGLTGGAGIGAWALTNPRFVRWLAQSTRPMTEPQQAAHLARLTTIFETADDKTKQDLAGLVQSMQPQRNE